MPTGCAAYDQIDIGGKIEYHVAYGVTSCERLTATTTAALDEWGDQHEAKRLALFAACNGGVATTSPWLRMRCNHACRNHYRIRTIGGALGAEVCQSHPDAAGCVDSQHAGTVAHGHWALGVRPKLAAAALAAALPARQGAAAAAALAAHAAGAPALASRWCPCSTAATAAAHAARSVAAALVAAAALAAARAARDAAAALARRPTRPTRRPSRRRPARRP